MPNGELAAQEGTETETVSWNEEIAQLTEQKEHLQIVVDSLTRHVDTLQERATHALLVLKDPFIPLDVLKDKVANILNPLI